MYVRNAGHGRAFGVLYVRMVPIDSDIPERCTEIYGHVGMGVFSGIGAPLMYLAVGQLVEAMLCLTPNDGCRIGSWEH